jgi:hypothetical protein
MDEPTRIRHGKADTEKPTRKSRHGKADTEKPTRILQPRPDPATASCREPAAVVRGATDRDAAGADTVTAA